MAKKTKKQPEHYSYIRAIVDCGSLRWEYQLKGKVAGHQSHDEDVSEWEERDIIAITRSMLDVDADDPVIIEVRYA